MRVLLTATAATDQRLDGLTIFAESLATHLSREGHTCALFVSDLEQHPVRAELTTTEVNGLSVFRAALPEPRSPEEALDVPGAADLFRQVLADFTPDIIHLHALELLAAGMIEAAADAAIPTVMTLHDFYLICPAVRLLRLGGVPCPGPDGGDRCGSCPAATGHLTGRYRGPLRWLARRWDVAVRRRFADAYRARFSRVAEAVKRLGAVVAPSEYLAGRTADAGMLGSCEVIPNGSDVEPLPPRNGGGPPVIGMLAHHSAAKGTHLLVDALARMRAVPLRVVIHGGGEPKYLAAVRKQARPDDRIAFEGPFTPADVRSILAGLDAVVLPSIYPENCPLVVQDALAAGRPCVVPSEGGAADVVADGRNGLHFASGDAAALADALTKLTSEPDRIVSFRENLLAEEPVIARAEAARRYLALYQRLLERPAPTSP